MEVTDANSTFTEYNSAIEKGSWKAQRGSGIAAGAIRRTSGFPGKDARMVQAEAQRQVQNMIKNKDSFKVVGTQSV